MEWGNQMDKELLEKIAYAKEIILEIEKREKWTQHSKVQVCSIQMERGKQQKKLKFSYIISRYILWGLLVLALGFVASGYVGAAVLSFTMTPETFKMEYLFDVAKYGSIFIGIIYTIIYCVRVIRNRKKGSEIIEQTIVAETSMKQQQADTIKWCQEELKKIDFIPKEYQYSIAIEFFYTVLNNGRADDWKECMNLYEEQIHRWKMERGMTNFQNMQAVQNARMNAMERELKWTKATADVALISHLF